jgi:hypothetical protein
MNDANDPVSKEVRARQAAGNAAVLRRLFAVPKEIADAVVEIETWLESNGYHSWQCRGFKWQKDNDSDPPVPQ